MKLYKVDYKYIINIKTPKHLFSKQTIPGTIQRISENNFIVCDIYNIKKKIEQDIEAKIDTWTTDILEEGDIDLVNWSDSLWDCGEINVREITGYELVGYNYKEATIKECFNELSPTEFVKIYGSDIITLLQEGEQFNGNK